jgi:hypothetical protein
VTLLNGKVSAQVEVICSCSPRLRRQQSKHYIHGIGTQRPRVFDLDLELMSYQKSFA